MQQSKYSVTRTEGTEILTIRSLTLQDDDVYRCYTLFDEDYVYYNVTIVSKSAIISFFQNGNLQTAHE